MANSVFYWGLVFAQLVTLVGYVVVTAGAGLLQKKANTLTLFDGLNADQLKATQDVYNNVFQSASFIVPYPGRPKYQFSLQWWIIEFELFVFLLTAAATVFPAFLPRLRRVALPLLAYGMVVLTFMIDAVWYFLRDDTAKLVYGKKNLEVAQAGLMIVVIANGLTILCMGLHDETPAPAANQGDATAYVKPVAGNV